MLNRQYRVHIGLLSRFVGINAVRCLLSIVLGASYVVASDVVPIASHADQLSYVVAGEGENDLLHVRTANAMGISYNHFDTFSVTDKKLKLVNVSRTTDTGESAAQLIIIMADTISLQNIVEVVGPASDILFISTAASGAVSCNGCEIKNTHRVTFAAATPQTVISDSSSGVGALTTTAGGLVSINNLKAAGSLSLDLLAETIDIQNSVSLQQRVNRDSSGGYLQDDNGDYLLGTGGLNALIGDIKWDYEGQNVLEATPRGGSRTIDGNIAALSVKVTTPEKLIVNSVIATHSDLVSSVRYLGLTHITDEQISFQSLGGDIALNGDFESTGEISAKAFGSLTVFPTVKLTAGKATLIAKNSMLNLTHINADNIEVAASSVVNRGQMIALYKADVWAEKNIANEFGGVILGASVTLQAEQGVVRNGSRFPYLTSVDSAEAVDLLTLGGDVLNPADATHLGSFYNDSFNVVTGTNRTRPTYSHAYIQANNLSIKATAVENINPYWERIDEVSNSLLLDRNLSNQVTISAEDSLKIEASNYVLNTSSVMRVNKQSGLLAIKTGILTSERYRTLSLLSEVTEQQSVYDAEVGAMVDKDVVIGYASKAYTYSPAGMIISMGDFHVDATVGFVNNTAYLEVYGDAQFKTSTINDIGLKQEGMTETASLICFPDNFFLWGNANPDLITGGQVCLALGPDVQIDTSLELDSLFFVHGNVYGGNETSFTSLNHKPYDFYKYQAAKNVLAEKYSIQTDCLVEDGCETDPVDIPSFNLYNFAYRHSVSYVDGEDGMVTALLTTASQAENIDGVDLSHVEVKEESFSLIDELAKIFESLTQILSDLFAEIDWWS